MNYHQVCEKDRAWEEGRGKEGREKRMGGGGGNKGRGQRDRRREEDEEEKGGRKRTWGGERTEGRRRSQGMLHLTKMLTCVALHQHNILVHQNNVPVYTLAYISPVYVREYRMDSTVSSAR